MNKKLNSDLIRNEKIKTFFINSFIKVYSFNLISSKFFIINKNN